MVIRRSKNEDFDPPGGVGLTGKNKKSKKLKIAFTFNLKKDDSEDQAEYESPETVAFIENNIKKCGYIVEKIELSRPLAEVINHLTSFKPDLIFNIAEGGKGKLREAFWPLIFKELGYPHTGSTPHTLAITLDKSITKEIVKKAGILIPKGLFIDDLSDLTDNAIKNLSFPLIIKPNFEGSSKGIGQNNVVKTKEELIKIAKKLLKKYTEGCLVEEYIDGKDITVPYLEHLSSPVLDPLCYIFDENLNKKYDLDHAIYDYLLKDLYDNYIKVESDKRMNNKLLNKIISQSFKIIKLTNCRDFGRIDFRLSKDNKLYFLEINPLANLAKDVAIYVSAKKRQINEREVINLIIKSALKRHKIKAI